MTINIVPLTFPASVDKKKFVDFGREVKGVHPGNLSANEFKEVEEALYKHDLLLFRDVDLSLEEQLAFVKAFDPQAESYTHKTDALERGVIGAYINTIPRVPQVQVIGHGTIHDHEGIPEVTLLHGHHANSHKTRVSLEDENGSPVVTRFFGWHMDAALYELSPPKATALYAIRVPKGPTQIVRYDDGSGDELSVTLGTTAFASGKIMFDILPTELKSLAVRARVRYAPHPFEWMAAAKGVSTGLGLESEGLEKPLDTLTSWDEEKVKVYPLVWKNPVTGSLYLQVHPFAISEIYIEPVPESCRPVANNLGVLYPDGGHIIDLRQVRELVYSMQRPAIAPNLVHPHPWEAKDLVIFNNRGLIHTVVGLFKPDQVRIFHQCGLAGPDEPAGPSEEDKLKWVGCQ